MSLGVGVTKADVDQVAGAIAGQLRDTFERIESFKEWLDTVQVADLEALGFTTAEANTLKSAYADAAQLRTIFLGTATLAVAKDFRAFLKLCWGIRK